MLFLLRIGLAFIPIAMLPAMLLLCRLVCGFLSPISLFTDLSEGTAFRCCYSCLDLMLMHPAALTRLAISSLLSGSTDWTSLSKWAPYFCWLFGAKYSW